METHVIMTFCMPPSSGLCVKSCLRCSDFAASPSVPACFSKMLAWNAYNSSRAHVCGDAALNLHRAHALPTARSDFPVVRKEKKKKKRLPREGFHCLSIIFWRKDEWSGRGTSAKQMKICPG